MVLAGKSHALSGLRVHATGAPIDGYVILNSGLIPARSADGCIIQPFRVPADAHLSDIADQLEEHIHMCSLASMLVPTSAVQSPRLQRGMMQPDAKGRYPAPAAISLEEVAQRYSFPASSLASASGSPFNSTGIPPNFQHPMITGVASCAGQSTLKHSAFITREPMTVTQKRVKQEYARGLEQRWVLRSRRLTVATAGLNSDDDPWPGARLSSGASTPRPLAATAPSSPMSARPSYPHAATHLVERPSSAPRNEALRPGVLSVQKLAKRPQPSIMSPRPSGKWPPPNVQSEVQHDHMQQMLENARRSHGRVHGRTLLPSHWTCGEHWDGVPRAPPRKSDGEEPQLTNARPRRASASGHEPGSGAATAMASQYYLPLPAIRPEDPSPAGDEPWRPPPLRKVEFERKAPTIHRSGKMLWREAKVKVRFLKHWRVSSRQSSDAWIKRKSRANAKLPLELEYMKPSAVRAKVSPATGRASTRTSRDHTGQANASSAKDSGDSDGPHLKDDIPGWWHSSSKRTTVLGFAKPDPTESILNEVKEAADQFDARQVQRGAAASKMNKAVLVPRSTPGEATYDLPQAKSLLGVDGRFPHPPHPQRSADKPSAPKTTRDRAIAAAAAIGEWTSQEVALERRDAQYEVFANRYVPPAALEFNRPVKPFEPGDDMSVAGLAWTRPARWKYGPPFDPTPQSSKLRQKPLRTANDDFERQNPGLLAKGGGRQPAKESSGPGLGGGRTIEGAVWGPPGKEGEGVIAGVRTSLDEPGAPVGFSLRLFAGDSHAAIFNTVASELNSESAKVTEVTLSRTDGGSSITLKVDSSNELQGWPQWAESGRFELFATMVLDSGSGRSSPATVGGKSRGGASQQKRAAMKEKDREMVRLRAEQEAMEMRGDGADGSPMTDLEALLVMEADAEEQAIEEAMDRGDRSWVGEIWSGRAAESQSGDFFDSDAVFKRRFDREWGEQMELMGDLADGEDSDDLQQVMWDCDDLMLVLFDYYGSLNSDGRISSLTFNEWTMFCYDFNLHSGSTSKMAELDRVFISVDTKASAVAKRDKELAESQGRKFDSDADEMKALKRTEFCTALVQIASIHYLNTGIAKSLAEAMHKLMMEVIDPLVDYDRLPDPNLFRRSVYLKSVSEALGQHAPSLRLLHTALAEAEFGKGAKRMGATAWLKGLRAVNFVGIDITERDANLCLVWSRMASSKSTALDDRLPFEGFMEVRVSSILAPHCLLHTLDADGVLSLCLSVCLSVGLSVRLSPVLARALFWLGTMPTKLHQVSAYRQGNCRQRLRGRGTVRLAHAVGRGHAQGVRSNVACQAGRMGRDTDAAPAHMHSAHAVDLDAHHRSRLPEGQGRWCRREQRRVVSG